MRQIPSASGQDYLPLTVEEVAWLLENLPRSFMKDKNQVEGFIRRALATAVQLRQVRLDFDAELRRRSAMMPATGGAQTAANPELAARFLSPEQLKALFDGFAQERLSALEDARQRAESRENLAVRALQLAVKASSGNLSAEEELELRDMMARYGQ
jgi:hypothetical protein